MVDNEQILKLYGFVARSPYRKMVLLELGLSPSIPKDIAKRLNINVNHVSRALSQLKAKNLVKCINPEEKKGRVYQITEIGQRVLNRIKISQKE
jgi:DNA-binding MarR family transcriptional regulator